MQLLCEHFNEVMPREKALRKIWGEDSYFTTRSMDVYITKLRKRMGGRSDGGCGWHGRVGDAIRGARRAQDGTIPPRLV